MCLFMYTYAYLRITPVSNPIPILAFVGETATTFFTIAHAQLLNILRLPAAAATAAATHTIFNATKNNMSWKFHFDLVRSERV